MPYLVDETGTWVPDPQKSRQENRRAYEEWNKATFGADRDAVKALRTWEDYAQNYKEPPAAVPAPAKPSTASRGASGTPVDMPFILPSSPVTEGDRPSFKRPAASPALGGYDMGSTVSSTGVPIAPIPGFVPAPTGAPGEMGSQPLTGPDLWRRQRTEATFPGGPPVIPTNIQEQLNAAGRPPASVPAPQAQPTVQPDSQPSVPQPKVRPPIGSEAWIQSAAEAGAKARITPPPARPAPPPPAPMPVQQQAQQPNLMALGQAALPFFTPASSSSMFPDFTGAGSAVGSTAQPAPAMQLDPANLQNLAGAQTAQGAGASSNPANLMRLAQIGQAMATPQQSQAMAPQVRPVEMPGRATVRMDGEAEKILALLLANKQTAMVPGLSRLVRG